MKLECLRAGAIFYTLWEDGTRVYAVKSQYRYPNGAPECVLLESGEYAHFPNKGDQEVVEVGVIPWIYGEVG